MSLISDPNGGIKETVYELLRTTWSLDDAVLLTEVDEVGRSWRAAHRRNEDEISAIISARKHADGH